MELRPAQIARRGIGKEEGAGKPRPRLGRWSAVLPRFLPRCPRPRDTDCPWSLRQPGCLDVSRVHDEGGVDVRSCHCQVRGESVWIARYARGALRFSSGVRTWARRHYARMDRSLTTRRKRRNAMYDGIKQRRDACSAVGTVRARTPHALPTMLALRRGSRRLELVAHQRGTLLLPTKWPEGRRRGRAGGRQEYRHFSSLAQPSPSASASLRIAVPR